MRRRTQNSVTITLSKHLYRLFCDPFLAIRNSSGNQKKIAPCERAFTVIVNVSVRVIFDFLGSVHTELLAIAVIAKNGYSTHFLASLTLKLRAQCERKLSTSVKQCNAMCNSTCCPVSNCIVIYVAIWLRLRFVLIKTRYELHHVSTF